MEKIEILRILDTYSNEDEAIKQRIANALLDLSNVVGQSEQLNCEHEWKVEAFDCYGMPYEQYCEHCGKKEAI